MDTNTIREIIKEEFNLIALSYKDVLTVSEGAKYLAITDDYMRKLCNGGKIKANKPNGKTWYIHRNDIINYAMSRTDETVQDEAKRQAQQYILKKQLKNT